MVGDHDFDLFKRANFNPYHEIWVTPESTSEKAGYETHEMDERESKSLETYKGRIVYNSAYNGKHLR